MSDLTYTAVGATRSAQLPAHWNHVRHRRLIGTGAATFARAREAVLTFEMHRRAGARVRTDARRAAPGVRLTVALGPFAGPCEVVYLVDEQRRAGFGYGTRAGHPETGEEAFVVEHDTADRVWLTVTAFSRPASWVTIAAGPLAELAQLGFARLLGRTLRRICTVNT